MDARQPDKQRGIGRSNPALRLGGQPAKSKWRDPGVLDTNPESASPGGIGLAKRLPIVLGCRTATSDCSAYGS